MDVCLLINTCKQYFQNIDALIQQIKTSKFNKANVLIVSGQEDEDDEFYYEGAKIVKVKYSGSHLTSVIYACENMNLFSNINYWIVLPCTVKFGETFFDKIADYYNVYLKDKEVHCLPFLNPNITPTMDLGIVHSKHILNMTNYLNKIKTFDVSYDNLIPRRAGRGQGSGIRFADSDDRGFPLDQPFLDAFFIHLKRLAFFCLWYYF